MSDQRRLKSIASRYDLDVSRHRDPWRMLRSRLSVIFLVGSMAACVPWLLRDHRAFQTRCVSSAHRVFEQDCQSCHDRSLVPLMRMVTLDNTIHSTSDKKCRVCHRESNEDHLSPSISGESPLSKRQAATDGPRGVREEILKQQLKSHLAELACAGCHQEHRGHLPLADVADAHCSRCHTTAHDRVSPRRFELNFSDFGHHPEFGIWRNRDQTPTGAAMEHPPATPVQWDGDRPVDRAAIKFSHHRHLDPKLPMPGGKTTELSCADCHQADASGAYFRPLTFAQDCQRCHTLGFPSTGELPHSKPEIIHGVLLDRLAKNDGKRPLPAAADELGGPTKAPLVAIKPDGDLPPNLDSLKRELAKLEQQLFAAPHPEPSNERPRAAGLLEAACTKCHFTERADKVGEAWRVIPPRLPEQWMSHSRFRHDRHASVDCQTCHTRNGHRMETVKREQFYPVMNDKLRASPSIYASDSARDVLMPRIEVCRQCHGHGSAPGSRSVGDRCVDCHAYHHTPLTLDHRSGIDELLKSDRPRARDIKRAEPPTEADP